MPPVIQQEKKKKKPEAQSGEIFQGIDEELQDEQPSGGLPGIDGLSAEHSEPQSGEMLQGVDEELQEAGDGQAEPDSGNYPDGVMSAEDFKKATYVRAAKRGEFLSRIDDALKVYDDYLEQQTEGKDPAGETAKANKELSGVKKLDTIEWACSKWITEHTDTKYNRSVNIRRPVINKLLISANLEKASLLENVKSKRSTGEEASGGDDDTGKTLSKAYNGKGLMPYKLFVRKIDDIKALGLFSVTDKLKKRRAEGEDAYLTKLLQSYASFEEAVSDKSDLSKMTDKDNVKSVTEMKYKKLLNLEKSCNDWLDAHKSKAGLLYLVKSGLAAPVTARRELIGSLVEAGGAIDSEKHVLEANFSAMADIARKEKGGAADAEKIEYENVRHESRNDIFGYEEFKGLTDAGKTSKRGDNLTRIDELIKQYHEQRKENRRAKDKTAGGKKESEILQKLYTAATYWLNLHKNDSGGSVQFRLPIIRELSEIAEAKLKTGGVDTEKLDAGKSISAVMAYKGVTLNKDSLPTLEEFLKLTYVSKLNRRDKKLKEIDKALEEYHKVAGGKNDSRVKELLDELKSKTLSWGITNQDKSPEMQNRIEAIRNLYVQIYTMQEKPAAAKKEGEEEADKQQEGISIDARALPTLDEFQNITYAGKTTRRGEYLKAIDKHLMEYDVIRVKSVLNEGEQQKALTSLKNLRHACLEWTQRHKGQEDGGSIGARKPYIDKMTMKDGLIAEEIKLLLRDKILSHQVDINDTVFDIKESADNFSSVFQKIGDQYLGEYGNEKKHFKIGGYVAVKSSFVPMSSVRATVFTEYDGEKNTELKDYSQPASDENKKTTMLSENKLGFSIGVKLFFAATANAGAKVGVYTKAKAKDPKECYKLSGFCTYNRLRRMFIIPSFVTNLIYGGSVTKAGYSRAEKDQSEAVGVLANDPGNYVEEGFSAGGEADAGIKLLASAKASGDVKFSKKRITREVVKKALMESGNVGDISFDRLNEEYLKQSEGGDDGTNKASKIHKSINKNKEEKEANRTTRFETSVIKKGKAQMDYKSGVLKKLRFEHDFDTDKYIAGESAVKTVQTMLNSVQDKFGHQEKDKEDGNYFDMLELELDSYETAFKNCIENYPPLVKLRKMKALIKKLVGADVHLALEVDTSKNLIKLYISRVDLDSTILALPALLASKSKGFETVEDGVTKALPVSLTAGLDIEFKNTAEDLIGYWPLKKSCFKASEDND